jgi:hypothetical protein
MKKIVGVLFVLLLALILLSDVCAVSACEPPPCPKFVTRLIAGQHYKAGYVRVWSDRTYLYVKFIPSTGWSLGETHVYVGDQPPEKSAPGRFPYKEGGDYYKIELKELGVSACQPLYIAAHAEVYTDCREETAWADEGAIPFGKGWAMYFVYPGCPCDS